MLAYKFLYFLVLGTVLTYANEDSHGDKGAVLVLGSGGLIGQVLIQHLLATGRRILGADLQKPARATETSRESHHSIDLRAPGALEKAFSKEKIDFVFLLACDVGGSKYIDAAKTKLQQRLIQNNIELYTAILPWLEERAIPFVFTSSYLQGEPVPYGAVKRLGEMWVQQMALGRSVRLWNVYGFQPGGLRAHVLNDWVPACERDGVIRPITDGHERRQFLHVNDTALGLISMMEHFSVLEEVTDMSTGTWISLRTLADEVLAIGMEMGYKCSVEWPDASAKKRTMPEPQQDSRFHQLWHPQVERRAALRDLFERHQRPVEAQSHGGMCSVNQDCGA